MKSFIGSEGDAEEKKLKIPSYMCCKLCHRCRVGER